MTRIWFTPHTARRTLERIRPAVERMSQLYRVMDGARPRRFEGDTPVERRYFEMALSLLRLIHGLGRAGVRVPNPRLGWIDFPARRAGRAVLLSWQLGESRLGHWRETDDALGARHPVDDDGPWEPVPPERAG